MYEQSALVLDAGDQYLGRLSLVLIGLGHRPLLTLTLTVYRCGGMRR